MTQASRVNKQLRYSALVAFALYHLTACGTLPPKGQTEVSQHNNGDHNTAIGAVQGDVNIGVPFEQYKADLEAKEKEIRQHLVAKDRSEQELKDFKIEYKAIQNKLANVQRSYEEDTQKLREQIARLQSLKGKVNKQQLEAAKQALVQGDSKKADKLFAQFYQEGEAQLSLMAEAQYQRGAIAEREIRYREAFQHYERAMQLQPNNVDYVNQTATLAGTLGQYPKALRLYKIALDLALQQYPKDAPEVARQQNNLGFVYYSLGEYAKAIEYYQLALASDLKTYGEGHPRVAIYRNNLGLAYDSLGKYAKAIEYYQLALASDLKTYGEGHPQVATYRNNLGNAYKSLGKYAKAIEYYELALASDLKTYGEGHPDVAIDRNNLGGAYKSLGEYAKAIEYYQLALASVLKAYGEGHPYVAATRNNLGSAYQSLGEYAKAIEYYQLALASDLKTYGEGHPSVATRRNNLGSAYYAQGDYQAALPHFETALKISLKMLGEAHPDTKTSQEWLRLCKEKLK